MERLYYDVFFSGPVYIYFSMFIENNILRIITLLIGIFTILYNLYNYLYFSGKIKNFIPFINSENGKTEIHRIYNLLLMYPFLFYVNYNTESPLKPLIYLMVVLGFSYNFYYLYKFNLK